MAAHEELGKALASAMAPLAVQADCSVVSLELRHDAEIRAQFGINESRVSQIHKRALERMAAVLRSAGITSSSSILPW